MLTETNEAFPIAKVYCWGDNRYGQLGDQTQFTRNSPNLNFPVDFTNIGNPINIELGDEFACAQIEVPNQTQTMIACWGRNQENQAGAQDVPVVTHPHMILKQDQQPLLATTLKLGAKHACAIDQNTPNTAYCWGNNQKGQLGLGNLQNQAFAQAVNTQTLAIDQVHEIALGDAHTCLLTSSADRQKSIRCVGETSKIQPYPSIDQVGASCIQEVNGSQRATCLNLPTLTIDMPLGVEPYGQLQSGGEHLSFMGVVDMTPMYFAFGQNQYGQLGFFEIANYLAYTFIPTLIYPTYGLYLIDQVILGGNQSYLLMQNDVLYTAGANDQGQLLIQSLVSQRLFTPTVFEHIYQFEAGKYSACALIEEAGAFVLKCGGGCHGAYLGIGTCQPCVDADYTLKPVIWQRD